MACFSENNISNEDWIDIKIVVTHKSQTHLICECMKLEATITDGV